MWLGIGFALSEIFSPLALPRLLYDYVINFCIFGDIFSSSSTQITL